MRRMRLFLTGVLAAFIVPMAAQAQHNAFFAPVTGESQFATAFPSCGSPEFFGPGLGPIGLAFDGNDVFVTDFCNGTTYKFGLAGGLATGAQSAANGLNAGLAVGGGNYFGGRCGPGCGVGGPPDGVYTFDPITLAVTGTVTELSGARYLALDPATGDLYAAGARGIWKIVNPATAPALSSFALPTHVLDGIAFTTDGAKVFVADLTDGSLHGLDKASATELPGFPVSLAGRGPDGIAIARPNTNVNGLDVSNNVFVNNNDGTITRIDTNNANAISDVATGGSRGDLATVGADGCLYAMQTSEVVKLTPCFFQSITTTTTTTTLPCTTAFCTLEAAQTSPECAGQAIPAGVTATLTRAENLLDRAATSPAKKARKLLNKAKGALGQAGARATRAAKGKKPRLTAGCAAALRDAASRAAAGL